MAQKDIIYYSGRVMECTRVRELTSDAPRAERKEGNSTPKKNEQNLMLAFRRLARTLNANFTSSDFFATFTYVNEPGSWEEHEKDWVLFYRRLNYKLQKEGKPDAKWVVLHSNINGKTGEVIGRHTHGILCGDSFEFRDGKIPKIWHYFFEPPKRFPCM